MSKVAIVYWSQTGNTEAMASAVSEGATAAGAEAELISAENFNAGSVANYDAIAFGCPSMGVEVLEESVFQPMWDSVKSGLEGKKIALFGSYGWGDGEWMRNWEAECKADGLSLVCDPVTANEAPDADALDKCKELGKALA